MKLSSFFPLTIIEKKVLAAWIVFSLIFFFYSFTQIDLGLVISRYPFFYAIEKSFQYIGYFRRDLSTLFYLIILVMGFSLFGSTLLLVAKQKISKNGLIVICSSVFLLLAFSYNAFSYDFFNYIFDAKILTHYHMNPYLKTALDFPGDPMLGFMHWTHRTYPYGPMWLVLTVPLSFIGGNIFIVTFFLFKILSLAAYSICIIYFYKIAEFFTEKKALLLTTLLALNPLFLLEFLISAHNDTSMFALGFMAIYYLTKKKQLLAYVLLFLSIGVKFATGFLLPGFLLVTLLLLRGKGFPKKAFVYISTIFMIIAFILVCYRTLYEPWYLIYIFPFALLFPFRKVYAIGIFLLSILSSLYYGPYLLAGAWDIASIGQALYAFQLLVFPLTLFSVIIFYLAQSAFVLTPHSYEK